MYDGKGQFVIVKKNEGVTKYNLRQKGLKEKLLCEQCETKLSKWERYSQRILFRSERKPLKKSNEILVFENVDYKKFKLFLMSVLWRMSVSQLEELSQVRLGSLHTERIRNMLLMEDAGEEDDYGCFITSIIFDTVDLETNENLRKFMTNPEAFKAQGHNCYRIFIGGFLYCFSISKHNIPARIRQLFLNKSNQLSVLVRGEESVSFVTDMLLDHYPDLKKWESKRWRLSP